MKPTAAEKAIYAVRHKVGYYRMLVPAEERGASVGWLLYVELGRILDTFDDEAGVRSRARREGVADLDENRARENETRRARYRRMDGELFEAAQIWRARRPSGLAWQCALDLGVSEERVLQLWEMQDEISADGAA